MTWPFITGVDMLPPPPHPFSGPYTPIQIFKPFAFGRMTNVDIGGLKGEPFEGPAPWI